MTQARLGSALIGLGLGVVLGFVLGCGVDSDAGSGGKVELTWKGAVAGHMSVPGSAIACASPGIIELTAAQGDTGLGLLIHPKDLGAPAGRYPITDPAAAKATTPGAALAMRFLGQTATTGAQSDSGTLTVMPPKSGRVSGQFRAKARLFGGSAPLSIEGRFDDVPLHPGGRACPR
jgi:hypothetical protein